jgi:hypothetical protein
MRLRLRGTRGHKMRLPWWGHVEEVARAKQLNPSLLLTRYYGDTFT